MKRFLPLLFLTACAPAEQATPVRTQSSQVITFRYTAIMDTVTAILFGRVVNLGDQQPLSASVQLATPTTTYRTVATPDGNFQFFHIPAGDYTLTVTCPAYTKLTGPPVHLGTGDAATTTIGMGRRAADTK